MANDQSFSYRLVKISLIILNSLVVIGFTLSLLLIGHHLDSSVVIFVLIIESNFVAAIVGAIRESRPLVLTTGSITLMILLLAAFSRTERTQNTTFTLLYFLAIVMLSYAFSAMLKERQLRGVLGHRSAANGGRQLSAAATAASEAPFAAVIVYDSPAQHSLQVALPMSPHSPLPDSEANNSFKDPPPPYEECPPPKYEDVTTIDNNRPPF
ncbi:unnamed protein product [Medioppia subpectinata]|uniref:Uncharacterized protein n=1 Tax=Medioppia subpectinata TaxID=1979941 RepID=A0A7R9KFZ2_9ACAR|nr:unnamed protein product [Medioppia subpectinata]CAG2102522.1 unnamed protein product [Medioppia subpectinata]